MYGDIELVCWVNTDVHELAGVEVYSIAGGIDEICGWGRRYIFKSLVV